MLAAKQEGLPVEERVRSLIDERRLCSRGAMKNLLLLLCLLPLLGCVGKVDVEPVTLDNPPDFAKAPGKYAVVILGGQWTFPADQRVLPTLPIQEAPLSCSPFYVRADTAYEKTAKRLLEATLDDVTILPSSPSYQELAQDGYDAAITIRQGPATAQFYVAGLSATARASVAVQTTVANGSGKSERRSFIGDGAATNQSIWPCKVISDALNSAFQQALQRAMIDATSALRSELPQAKASRPTSHEN